MAKKEDSGQSKRQRPVQKSPARAGRENTEMAVLDFLASALPGDIEVSRKMKRNGIEGIRASVDAPHKANCSSFTGLSCNCGRAIAQAVVSVAQSAAKRRANKLT